MNEPRPGIQPSQIPTIRPVGQSTIQPQGHAAVKGMHVPGARSMSQNDSALIDPLAENSSHVGADEPLTLADEASIDAVEAHQKKIRSYDEAARHRHHEWKREVHHTQAGATRVKSFHGKYSDQGLAFLDDSINEWLDAHPEADVKFVTSTVGMFDGKIKEPALVLNLWY